MQVIINGKEHHPTLTLKQWKERLAPGLKLLCVFRWYWDQPPVEVIGNLGKTSLPGKPAPPNGELCEIINVRATQATYKTPEKPLVYMDFPRASELKADDKGFELYFPIKPELSDPRNGPDRSGKLMSRYVWLPVLLFALAGLGYSAERKYYCKASHLGAGAVAISCLNGGDPTVAGRVADSLIVSCGTK